MVETETIIEIAKKLSKKHGNLPGYIGGSFATGTFDPERSDIDIYLVGKTHSYKELDIQGRQFSVQILPPRNLEGQLFPFFDNAEQLGEPGEFQRIRRDLVHSFLRKAIRTFMDIKPRDYGKSVKVNPGAIAQLAFLNTIFFSPERLKGKFIKIGKERISEAMENYSQELISALEELGGKKEGKIYSVPAEIVKGEKGRLLSMRSAMGEKKRFALRTGRVEGVPAGINQLYSVLSLIFSLHFKAKSMQDLRTRRILQEGIPPEILFSKYLGEKKGISRIEDIFKRKLKAKQVRI